MTLFLIAFILEIKTRGMWIEMRKEMKTEWLEGKKGMIVPGLNGVDGESRVVLMAHGFGSEKRGYTPLFMTRGLKEAGFGVYGFDFPAHGDSLLEGDQLTMARCVDSYATAETRVRELAPDAEIQYFGSSFGAYTTLLYLATCPHLGNKAFLRSAAIDMPQLIWRVVAAEGEEAFERDGYCNLTYYNRPLKLTRAFCEDINQYDIFELYRKGMAQLFMIHGELDSTAFPEAARKFALEKGAKLTMVPGAEHRLMEPGNPERALKAAIDFFEGRD